MSEGRLEALIFDLELEMLDKLMKLEELGRVEQDAYPRYVDFLDVITGEVLTTFINGEFKFYRR